MKKIPSLEFRLPWALKFDDFPLDTFALLEPETIHDFVIGRTREGVNGAATFLGKVAESGLFDKKMWLDLEGAHAVYVMGKRRGGKSHTLGVICEGLASETWLTDLDDRQGILVFDTMNVFLTIDQPTISIEGLDSGEIDWNMPGDMPKAQLFRPGGTPTIAGRDFPEICLGAHDLTAEEWIQTLGIDQFADVLGHLIYDAYERVRYSGYSTKAGEVEAQELFGVGALERCVTSCSDLVNTFRDETRLAAIRRFKALSRNSIFDDHGLDLTRLLRPGVITVLLLRDLPPETRELFVAVLVRRVMEARSETEHYERLLAAQGQTKSPYAETWKARVQAGTPRAWLVIDEAHNYIPQGRSAISKRPLKRLIDEGRNLGISILVATQQPSGLDTSIQRNADTLIIHPMSMEDDIRAASGMLNTVWPKKTSIARGGNLKGCDFYDAVRSLPRGYALISTETMPRVIPLLVRPRLTESGGKGY
ncbi:MAG: ATP-binding protein [Spirochaetia bacterium]|jgi:hypothetical protein